jgi:hypothetical protein
VPAGFYIVQRPDTGRAGRRRMDSHRRRDGRPTDLHIPRWHPARQRCVCWRDHTAGRRGAAPHRYARPDPRRAGECAGRDRRVRRAARAYRRAPGPRARRCARRVRDPGVRPAVCCQRGAVRLLCSRRPGRARAGDHAHAPAGRGCYRDRARDQRSAGSGYHDERDRRGPDRRYAQRRAAAANLLVQRTLKTTSMEARKQDTARRACASVERELPKQANLTTMDESETTLEHRCASRCRPSLRLRSPGRPATRVVLWRCGAPCRRRCRALPSVRR